MTRTERIADLRRKIAHCALHRQWLRKKDLESKLRPLVTNQIRHETKQDRKAS